MQREHAAEQLRSARADLVPGIRLALAVAEGRSIEEPLVRESRAGDYDLIMVPHKRRPMLPGRTRLADRLRARVACEVMTPSGR